MSLTRREPDSFIGSLLGLQRTLDGSLQKEMRGRIRPCSITRNIRLMEGNRMRGMP
ncbi:hypothetical protein D3C72_1296020 [compost metagenome]